MRVCPKCIDYSADRLLAFCPTDGTPLLEVDPSSDVWNQATRVIEQKQNAAKTEQRRLKWKRVVLTSMLMATVVVTVAAFSRSFSVTVERPHGKLCIEAFNDLNDNGERNEGEPGLSEFAFQVLGTDVDKPLTTDRKGSGCFDVPVGTYEVVAQPNDDWIATTKKTQTADVTTGRNEPVLFGFRQEGELCIETFNDLNRSRARNAGEPSLAGFSFQVSGSGINKTLTAELVRH